jgi:hypothetical protein
VWRDSKPYRAAYAHNADFTHYRVVLAIDRPPDPLRWGLMFSDAIHNLRSTLDHLIRAIAVHESAADPPPNDMVLAFPIRDTPGPLEKIKTLSADVQAAVDSVQPHARKHAILPPLLGLLRDLDNANKHRLIQVVMHQPLDMDFAQLSGLNPGAGQALHIVVNHRLIKDGSELVRLEFKQPAPDFKTNFTAYIQVAIRHTPGPGGAVVSPISELLIDTLIPEVKDVIGIVRSAVT